MCKMEKILQDALTFDIVLELEVLFNYFEYQSSS